jgi:urease accessory protein
MATQALPTPHPAMLLLADGRFPSGGHAHSFGTEAVISGGLVRSVPELEGYVRGRLATNGLVEAAFAACVTERLTAATPAVPWAALDEALMARTPSPAVRAASRSLGRQLRRAASRVWPSPVYAELGDAPGPLAPLVLGATASSAGLSVEETATVSLHQFTGALTTAAVRLLGLDPFDVAAMTARLAAEATTLAEAAAACARGPIERLPAHGSALTDVLAEHHTTWEVRLFAS